LIFIFTKQHLLIPLTFGFGFGAVENDMSMFVLVAGDEKVNAGVLEEPNDVDVATNGLPNIAGSELPLFLSTLIGELNWKP
jgi:hypothetical protein